MSYGRFPKGTIYQSSGIKYLKKNLRRKINLWFTEQHTYRYTNCGGEPRFIWWTWTLSVHHFWWVLMWWCDCVGAIPFNYYLVQLAVGRRRALVAGTARWLSMLGHRSDVGVIPCAPTQMLLRLRPHVHHIRATAGLAAQAQQGSVDVLVLFAGAWTKRGCGWTV